MAHLSGAAAFDPLVNLFFFELPEAANLMGGHLFIVDPPIGGIALDAKIFGYFIDREPPVFHNTGTLIIVPRESCLVLFYPD